MKYFAYKLQNYFQKRNSKLQKKLLNHAYSLNEILNYPKRKCNKNNKLQLLYMHNFITKIILLPSFAEV